MTVPDTQTDDLLTIPEAARYSFISEAGLRARVRTGSLPAERVGPYRSIVIARSVLDELLLTGSVEPRR
jgi:hypothetical protein